jgi:hypothetical protein
MFDIQAATKSKYYDHIVLLYLESRRCRYGSIIFACFHLYITVVIFIDYSDIDKMMDINNESKTIRGGTSVQTIMYISITKGLCTLITHINYFL